MDSESPATSLLKERANADARSDTEIELLARETHTPREIVAKIYAGALAKLERTARIKTYIPVLIHRQVKALLREQLRT